MEFKTKCNLGDTVWFMKNNKPIEVIITSIHIFHSDGNLNKIKYSASNIINSISWIDHENLFENTVFKLKSELLESL